MAREQESPPTRRSTDKSFGYELLMAFLSVLSIVNLVLVLVLPERALQLVVYAVNALLTLIFLLDFVSRFVKAESKLEYMGRGYGWADLISALPFPQTNILRIFRLFRVYRLLKDFGWKPIRHALFVDTAGTALYILIAVTILVVEFGSLVMLSFEETAPGSNIDTAGDALWYVVVTISTVGYGDYYPVTPAGRLVGVLIIVVGVSIFGTLSGYLANLFLTPSSKRSRPVDNHVDDVDAQLAAVKDLMEQQQRAIEELETVIANSKGGGPKST